MKRHTFNNPEDQRSVLLSFIQAWMRALTVPLPCSTRFCDWGCLRSSLMISMSCLLSKIKRVPLNSPSLSACAYFISSKHISQGIMASATSTTCLKKKGQRKEILAKWFCSKKMLANLYCRQLSFTRFRMQYSLINIVGLDFHIYEIHLNSFKWIAVRNENQRRLRDERPVLITQLAMINYSGHFFFDNFIILVSNLCPRLVSSHVTTLKMQWPNELSNIVHHDHLSKIILCPPQMIKLIILQSEIVDCSISSITKLRSDSFSNNICQENLIFASLFVIYSEFIFFDIFEISKPFQELVFNDSIDCTNKRFAGTDCPWGPRGHRSAIKGCDESGSHESSERENESNRWKKSHSYQ